MARRTTTTTEHVVEHREVSHEAELTRVGSGLAVQAWMASADVVVEQFFPLDTARPHDPPRLMVRTRTTLQQQGVSETRIADSLRTASRLLGLEVIEADRLEERCTSQWQPLILWVLSIGFLLTLGAFFYVASKSD